MPRVAGLPPFRGGIAGMMAYELGAAGAHSAGACQEFSISVYRPRDFMTGSSPGIMPRGATADLARIGGGDPQQRPHALGEGRACCCLANTQAQAAREWKTFSVTRIRSRQVKQRAWQGGSPDCPALSDFSRDGYLRTVDRVLEYIRAGDTGQFMLQRLLCCCMNYGSTMVV
ncbi:MAG: hypothetical protein U0872_10405 [Planctomycetaceae bacterium]